MKQRVVFAFGPWKLDPVAKVLFRNGEPVHMTRKAVETLLVLVENPGRVLTKEEIMSAVWTDRVVDEANLAQNIAVVRRILAAEKGSPAHIETFPGRGYRLEGPVITETDEQRAPEPDAAPPPPPPVVAPVRPPPAVQSRRKWVVGSMLVAAGLALAAYRAVRTNEPESIARVSPVTRLAGKEFQAAISRDGSRVAFLWAEDGSTPPEVWVQDTNGSNSRPLSKGGHHSSPAWSPDGSSVAFLRIQKSGTEVVIVPMDGRGAERIVSRFGDASYGYDHRMLDWSPDGRRIVVSRGTRLHIFDIDSGRAQTLTNPVGAVGDLDPRFSPDGARVSFLRLIHRTQQEIFTVPVGGGAETQVTNLARRISSHDWLRDGKSIVFASDRDGNFRLWRLGAAAGGGQSATALGVYSEFPIQISAARAADSLVYSALQQDRNIWRLNLAELQWKRLIASSGQDASPQYSPSGDRICFRSDRSGEEQLWVSNADGSEPKQITQGAMRPSVGRWSPDGASIVFNSPATGEVGIAQQAGRDWTVRSTGVQGVHPVFSTDGQWVYAGGPSGIIRFPPTGVPVEKLSSMKSEALALSADGKYLYFASEPTDTALWRLDLGTKNAAKVLDGLVPACTSCWALSPDGVYYLGTDRESFDRQVLFFWDLKTSTAKSVIQYPEPLWPLGSGPFSLGPGGNLLVVRVEPSNSDIMIVSPLK